MRHSWHGASSRAGAAGKGDGVMQPKPFFQSKTIVGAVMMAVSLALQFYQVDASTDELAKAGVDLTNAIEGVVGFVGFVMVIWGRLTAKAPIKPPLG